MGHDFSGNRETEKEPGCETSGIERVYCVRCDAYEIKKIESTGHAFGSWVQIKAPGCEISGTEERECKKCGKKEQREIAATGHSWGDEEEEAPTCTVPGKKFAVCSRCGQKKDLGEIPPIGHVFGEWITEREPGCLEGGVSARKCSLCGCVEETEIPAQGHSFGEWETVKEPGCTEDGERIRKCDKCGAIEKESIGCPGHDFGPSFIRIRATCREQGEKAKKCRRCGFEEKTGNIPQKEHEFGRYVELYGAGCITEGKGKKYCSGCDASEDVIIPPLGHDLSDWVTVKEPACEEEGVRRRNCAREGCRYYLDEKISAAGHDFGEKIVGKEPTCTEAGRYVRKCSVCGKEQDAGQVKPLGHKYSRDNKDGKLRCVRCNKEKNIYPRVIAIVAAWVIGTFVFVNIGRQIGISMDRRAETAEGLPTETSLVEATTQSPIEESAATEPTAEAVSAEETEEMTETAEIVTTAEDTTGEASETDSPGEEESAAEPTTAERTTEDTTTEEPTTEETTTTGQETTTESETPTEEPTTEEPVTPAPVVPERISASVNGRHFSGDELSASDFAVSVYMSDGSVHSSGWTAQPLVLGAGSNRITVSYTGNGKTVSTVVEVYAENRPEPTTEEPTTPEPTTLEPTTERPTQPPEDEKVIDASAYSYMVGNTYSGADVRTFILSNNTQIVVITATGRKLKFDAGNSSTSARDVTAVADGNYSCNISGGKVIFNTI